MRAELADGRILEFPDGTDPAVIQATVKKLIAPEQESPSALKSMYGTPEDAATNIVGAAVEPMMAIGSGMAGSAVGGLMGLGTMAGRVMGLTEADPTEVIRSTQEDMTYQPRTEGGKIALNVISYPFRKLSEGAEYLGESVAEREARMGSSPEAAALKGTLVKTSIEALPMLLGARASKTPSVISPKVEAGIKGTVKYIPKKLVEAAAEGKKIISHRLPGGADRAIKDLLPELVGERMPEVIKALEKGKELETAGQAATRAGSYEFSALQKFVESRKPSEYGDIARSQQHARLKILKNFGKSPEDLYVAESLMKKHAAEGYGKVQDVKTGITPNTLPPEFSSRPSFQRALQEAQQSALEKGTKGYFPKGPDEPFTVGNLQRIKRAMADELKPTAGTPSPLKKTQLDEVGDTVKSFTEYVRGLSDDFAKAEDIFSQEVRHVNRMKVLQSLSREMQKPLGDKEPAAAFTRMVKDSSSAVKDELGNKIPIHKTLKQKQINAIDRIQREYNRDAMMEQQASKGMQSMNEVLGTMHDIPRVHILKTSIVILNSLLKKIEGVNTKATLDRLTELMKPQNKAKLVEMMKAATPKERSVIMQGFGDQATVAAAIAEAEKQ